MADIQQTGVDEILRYFEQLDDPRSAVKLQHPLVCMVVIALMAILAGANGPTAIARWAALKEDLLVEVLDLPNGVPRKDVFRRVLMAHSLASFQACFADWLRSLRQVAATRPCISRSSIDHVAEQWEDDFARLKARRHQTEGSGHGRTETRSYIQMLALDGLRGLDLWAGLKSIGVAVSEWVRGGRRPRSAITSAALGWE